MPPVELIIGALLIGGFAGMVSGLFGVGGGFVIVPMLVAFLGIEPALAVGTAMCVTLANAAGAYVRYAGVGAAESRFDWMLLGGSVLGVTLGAYLLDYLQSAGSIDILGNPVLLVEIVLVGLYVLVFGALATMLLILPTKERTVPAERGLLARIAIAPYCELRIAGMRVSGPVVGVVGFINGFLSGMMGLGGGITLVPIMLYGFGFDMIRAAGTGIVVLFLTTFAGTLQLAWRGNVDLVIALVLMISAGIFTQVGVQLTSRLPSRASRVLLASVMVLAAGILLARALLG